ncbi:MAG: transcription termination factor Rho [Actinomycetes bacterium]|jgi:transcription termination factor Rho|nr:transcription termination factor Rho [Actinomycetes bacterium]
MNSDNRNRKRGRRPAQSSREYRNEPKEPSGRATENRSTDRQAQTPAQDQGAGQTANVPAVTTVQIPRVPTTDELSGLKVLQLRAVAEGLGLKLRKSPIKKDELVAKVHAAYQAEADKAREAAEAAERAASEAARAAQQQQQQQSGKAQADARAAEEAKKKNELTPVDGILDTLPEGYGFLRTTGYLAGPTDVYVSASMIRRNRLRRGDHLVGKQARPPRENEKFGALRELDSINGMTPEESYDRPKFSGLTPVYPDERLTMERGRQYFTARTIDLVAPIGKGQRGMIVSPPKAGKTEILKDIAASIHANDPEVHLMCLLVDERPEEVTDMQRSIHGEVVSSTFDMPSENHIAVTELVLERAKRLVEAGRDVVILLDSITRLARAYNLAAPASGRILSGGVDSAALYPPKKFFGAARNIENGGSLTILATALVDTGSKMDEVIFEEFKGTGNMELRLDRNLADRRIFPAIDIVASGTRKEELLLARDEAPFVWGVRRILHNVDPERAMQQLLTGFKQTETNIELLTKMARKAAQAGNDLGSV